MLGTGLLTFCLSGCADADEDITGTMMNSTKPKGNTQREQELPIDIDLENITIEISGVEEEYKFLYVSDLHMIILDEEVLEEHKTAVEQRVDFFSAPTGVNPIEIWEGLPQYLDSYHADAVLFGGDMLDYASTSNIQCLQEGLNNLTTPYLYVRADHDYGNHYTGLDASYIKDLHGKMDGALEISLLEFPDFCIVGIDNNTSNITPEGLARFREIYALGKPIILLTHVPIASQFDDSLAEQSKKAWQDRALIWGSGYYYEPDANTKEFLDMIYREDSLVKEILSGHLHFSWDGPISNQAYGHVFAPAINGSIGLITVKGTE